MRIVVSLGAFFEIYTEILEGEGELIELPLTNSLFRVPYL